MTLLRRFAAHWPELIAHLKEDKDVPSKRELVLRPTVTEATEVALSESKQLFNMELSGSGSLNTRGTQLAGLTGATVALVATLADKWLTATNGATQVLLGGLIIVAMVSLFGAMYCAIFAVLPTSTWRTALAETLSNDLASIDPSPVQSETLSRSMAQAYLTMAEDQRVRNQAKADDMLLAYGFLALGVIVLLIAAVTFIGVRIGESPTTPTTTPHPTSPTPPTTPHPTSPTPPTTTIPLTP